MEAIKVTACVKLKDWTNKEGKAIPIYKVSLSDFTEGESFGKEIPVGTPVESLEITEGQYGKKIKLKSSGGGGGFGGGKQRSGNESFALSYSKDLVVAGKVTIEQIIPVADKLYQWLESKKQKL